MTCRSDGVGPFNRGLCVLKLYCLLISSRHHMEQRPGCGVHEDGRSRVVHRKTREGASLAGCHCWGSRYFAILPYAYDYDSSGKFIIIRVFAHNRIYMVMVLSYDIVSLDTRASWWT
ncbi:hypothetical protein FOXG_20906 [Fusarium oxysporum f. sp. lycopersici 4287]|uniref:Uncharacterized protein n=1 Tax=Fusarium oxysporum f. sp. lycopersici (strain 4287 / CBS 123668 / FGSC 9935 / NRRL 34936) TaxID=426428 RepID=A0A0J9WS66_FUSO4|nr:hypothetical protein FOXG_20906 [Fusarium oxysporum f. sp. lycopersici 4287]XP_018251793.1 hypothetical protein FOXG_20906 [Fusarium oxysporum f. sp. lycopersici 4287]XP_018251794.1 hypothetical protein FOXG_20906 [Fusarium oxysporum f. sp. lycopersici 4287]EWZ78367.1 hypothetical protein FOWG_17381 [Fusarium oxysporum f. sp. lycopersici MN25]EWZ78368.1 hypothetical protein FOWG_17381 [Fusarium oxysporum f. sp. lycopersici MN25]EWZ78369.1 hypothetical protein FOWG_17381 [Fusarium oxysporum 